MKALTTRPHFPPRPQNPSSSSHGHRGLSWALPADQDGPPSATFDKYKYCQIQIMPNTKMAKYSWANIAKNSWAAIYNSWPQTLLPI